MVETHYAKSGDLRIAYQVVGKGPLDLVFVPGFISNLDHYWDEPNLVHFISRLSTFSRLVLFDKRGTGLSDRVGNLPDVGGADGRCARRHGRRRQQARGIVRHF